MTQMRFTPKVAEAERQPLDPIVGCARVNLAIIEDALNGGAQFDQTTLHLISPPDEQTGSGGGEYEKTFSVNSELDQDNLKMVDSVVAALGAADAPAHRYPAISDQRGGVTITQQVSEIQLDRNWFMIEETMQYELPGTQQSEAFTHTQLILSHGSYEAYQQVQ